MIALDIEKNLVDRFVNALTANDKIEAQMWTDDELLTLAGCAIALFLRRNPQPPHGQRLQCFVDLGPLSEDLVTALNLVGELVTIPLADDWDNCRSVVSVLVDHNRFKDGVKYGVKYIGGNKEGID